MPQLTFHFHEAFFIFLNRINKKLKIVYGLDRRASIKDIIESLGVPHTEVGKILLGNQEIGFNFIPEESVDLSIFPITPPFDVLNASLLRPEPLDKISFIVDINVGKLAPLLRVLGMDAKYSDGLTDNEISLVAEQERRIVLSRDTHLLKRKQIIFGRMIRSIYPYDQLEETISFFGIKGPFKMFSLCLRCNRELFQVNKEDILHRLEPKTKKYFNSFKMCPECNRIYWRGSHHENIKRRLKDVGMDIS